MPEISRFFGIVITMYADDHEPPHFHARYAEHEAMIRIEDGEIVRGSLPRHALRLVQDWAELHKQELLFNFKESQNDDPQFKKIEPLDK